MLHDCKELLPELTWPIFMAYRVFVISNGYAIFFNSWLRRSLGSQIFYEAILLVHYLLCNFHAEAAKQIYFNERNAKRFITAFIVIWHLHSDAY
jgi:hypothetical protein